VGQRASAEAAAPHCVQREEFAGGFERLYIRQGTLASTSFVSFKSSAVWHLDPDVTHDKGPQ